MKRAIALALAAAAGGAAALVSAAPASAHAALVSTDPEDGAVISEAPAEVSATFSEILDGESTEIAVTDPSGAVVEVADPVYDGDTFTQPMRYTTPGTYTVAFRVISEDGHRVDDALDFTVEFIPEDLYAAGAAPTGEATADASTEATGEASEETSRATGGMTQDEEDSNTGAALAAILLGLLVVVVGGVILVKTLGRKQPADEGDGDSDGKGEGGRGTA